MDTVFFIFVLFLAILQTVTIAYEIKTGNIIGGDWKPWFKRQANPRAYWIIILAQIIIALTIVSAIVVFLT